MREGWRTSNQEERPSDTFGSIAALLGLPGHATRARSSHSDERIRAGLRVLPFVLVVHLLAFLIMIVDTPGLVGNSAILLSFAATIAIDSLFLLGRAKKLFGSMQPASVARTLCGYAATVGATWGGTFWYGGKLDALSSNATSGVTLIGAFIVATVAFSGIPAAAICHALVFVILVALSVNDLLTASILIGAMALSAAVLIVSAKVQSLALRDHEQAELSLRQASRLLKDFEASGKGWFWEADAQGGISYLSSSLIEQLAGAPEEIIGIPLTSLIVHERDEQTPAAMQRTIGFHMSARTAFSDIVVRAANQEDVWWSLSGTPSFDDDGHFIGFRGSGTDLSKAKRADAEIVRLAHYDALTGLPNRLLMRATLQDALETRGKQRKDCALFMLDLDRFKSVNDTLGHPVGDALLQEVAKRLSHVVETKGRVGRLGGDEFTVVVPNVTNKDELAELAKSIIARLSYPYTINGTAISIGASVGIAISPLDGDCPDELARNADLALYAAKDDGRGVHRFYAPEMHSTAKDQRLLEIDLREALGRDELHLMYQPIVEVVSEEVVGFEALVRWHHPSRGILSPSDFIPIAEEIGIIPRVGEWVLRNACVTAAGWPSHIRLAVNLSPLQFEANGLPAIVTNALAASGLHAGRLELELTESVFLNKSASIDATFLALKGLGVRLALDDFGTGYASLANLKRLPFDKVKIDQSFVRGASIEDSRDAPFIRAIVQLAEALGMETTAEGAETIGEVELIRSLGCSQAQGYIFGEPMTPEEALECARKSAGKSNSLERPREPRLAVLRFAVLHSDHRNYPVRIRNVSSGGALIEIDPDARLGKSVIIELNEQERYPAGIRWMKGRLLGMAFSRPVDVTQIIRAAPSEPARADEEPPAPKEQSTARGGA
ncbi:MAG: diguanylate cyclase [Alphaproteobacteria bacterium]|nr:diguanylate cyclase [Alphaproteobacteria bacterium]